MYLTQSRLIFLLDTNTTLAYSCATMNRKQRKVAEDKDHTVAALPEACSDESAAVAFLERTRWPETPGCVHCGSVDVYQMHDRVTGERSKRFLWRCTVCKRQYTVRTGTVLEDSRIPLRHWCYTFWAACSSKKGVSALQIKRMTGLSYKSALFLMHRIRWAMADNHDEPPKLQGIVEADETYVGGKPRYPGRESRRAAYARKSAVFAMVQRGGDVRVEMLGKVTQRELWLAIRRNVDLQGTLSTDELSSYDQIGRKFGA